jgi:hypothetical protein
VADSFTLSGQYSTTPYIGVQSGVPSVSSVINERVALINKLIGQYSLEVDAPVAVDLGGLANVNVLVVKAIGGKVRLRITSADGSAQAIPVDGFLALIDLSVPVTAIDLTRVTGTSTNVEIFLGQRA